MTNRFDHAAEAQKSLESLTSWDTYTHEPAVLKKALVHATLALVEQQRIANLIALMHVPTGDLGQGIKASLHAAFPPRDWEADLESGLGLS